VKNNQSITIYLLTFLVLSIILKLFNVITISIAELTGYALIFYGVNLVYNSFGKDSRGILFTGTFLFFGGLMLFLLNNFEFANVNEIVFPALLFILGICFLMLFFDNKSRRNLLVIAVTFLLTGIIVTTIVGVLTLSSFFEGILLMASKYWPVALIVIGIILLIHRDEKRQEL
jgi:hypothetical protein